MPNTLAYHYKKLIANVNMPTDMTEKMLKDFHNETVRRARESQQNEMAFEKAQLLEKHIIKDKNAGDCLELNASMENVRCLFWRYDEDADWIERVYGDDCKKDLRIFIKVHKYYKGKTYGYRKGEFHMTFKHYYTSGFDGARIINKQKPKNNCVMLSTTFDYNSNYYSKLCEMFKEDGQFLECELRELLCEPDETDD